MLTVSAEVLSLSLSLVALSDTSIVNGGDLGVLVAEKVRAGAAREGLEEGGG